MSDIDPRVQAYRAGRTLFMGVEVLIAPGILIPRTETELLGQTALKLLTESAVREPRVIDMCCGAGNLACAIAHVNPHVHVWASDLTDGAVRVTRSNVTHLDLDARVTVLQGDLFDAFAELELENAIDLIVCNPPYISTGKLEKDSADLLSQEPREAFDGGPYGVSIFQRVIRDSPRYLKPGGTLMFEIGVGQEKQVRGLFERAKRYCDLDGIRDARGEVRIVLGRLLT